MARTAGPEILLYARGALENLSSEISILYMPLSRGQHSASLRALSAVVVVPVRDVEHHLPFEPALFDAALALPFVFASCYCPVAFFLLILCMRALVARSPLFGVGATVRLLSFSICSDDISSKALEAGSISRVPTG